MANSMAKHGLSEDEIIKAACYFVLPVNEPAEKVASMLQATVSAAKEYDLTLSPEFYAGLSDEMLKAKIWKAFQIHWRYSSSMRWTGDDGVISKLKALSYREKLFVLFAMHEFYCAKAELDTRNQGVGLVGGKA